MSKISPFLEQVVYVVSDFLKSINYNKEGEKLEKQFQIPEWVQTNNPLLKKGLKKILKEYINTTPKILNYFQNRKPQSEESEEEEQKIIVNNKKNNKAQSSKQSPISKPKSPKTTKKQPQSSRLSAWMTSQFAQPKRLQDVNDNEAPKVRQQSLKQTIRQTKKAKKVKKTKKETSSEQQSESLQKPKPKKQQKVIKKQKKEKKVKGEVDSSYLNSEEQFQLESKQTKKVKKVEQKKEQLVKVVKSQVQARKKSIENQTANQVQNKNIRNNFTTSNNNNVDNGPKKFFSRINNIEVGFIPENRRDNTFEAKARYGAGDSWGQFGYDKLKVTKGDSFKKTKGKLKNKAFQGSGINIDQINSVPIL